jgi:hypothetical protein
MKYGNLTGPSPVENLMSIMNNNQPRNIKQRDNASQSSSIAELYKNNKEREINDGEKI